VKAVEPSRRRRVVGAAGEAIFIALFDATGVRLRRYPLTPERVRAALAAGKTG